MRPHRQQPTRLPCPWDSPGKITGVDCHFLLQCMKVKSDSEVVQSCLTLSDPMECRPTRLLHPWAFPGKNIGVGCHFLLQGMKVKSEREVPQLCPTLRNPMDCSPPSSSVHRISQARILEWVAISFSRGSSRPRDGIPLMSPALAGRFFTTSATWEFSLGRPVV